MKLILFLLFFVILFVFVLASVVLIYHFVRFRMEKEHHRLLVSVFVVGSLLFFILEFWLFFSIDTEKIAKYFIKEAGQKIEQNQIIDPFNINLR